VSKALQTWRRPPEAIDAEAVDVEAVDVEAVDAEVLTHWINRRERRSARPVSAPGLSLPVGQRPWGINLGHRTSLIRPQQCPREHDQCTQRRDRHPRRDDETEVA